MHKHSLRAAALLAALALAGCKRGGPPPLPPGVAPVDSTTRLNTMSDVVVGQWLNLSRQEQAKIADEWAETIEKQTTAVRANPLSVELLPRVLPLATLTTPVFHQAKYSPSAGVSLPPYAVPGKPDAGLALHLARYGDHEAAEKFAPPEVRDRVAALKGDRNYNVEWTRLVGLVQTSAQLKLATGDPDGAMMLVAVHKQLGEALDAKAAAGPLGAALLPAGRTALERAAVAWRDKKRNKVGLAEDVENVVKEWGAPPTPTPALPFGAPTGDVQMLFGAAPRGKAVVADTPERVARVADLLGLPIPAEGAQSVVAFLDASGRLAEWQLAYRPKIDTLYASPAQVAFRLTEAGFAAEKENRGDNLSQQTFAGGGAVVEVTRCNRSPALGGLVRVSATKGGPAAAPTRDLRDFGPVHLDRGFVTNRLAVHPKAGGNVATVKDAQALARMAKVLGTPTPIAVRLVREKDADLVNRVELDWAGTENNHALDKLLPSLWDDYGPAKLDDVEDEKEAGAYLAFTWQDKATRVRLRLPYEGRGPSLTAGDVQTADQLKARAELARKLDEKDRQARLTAGKTEEWLSRSPGRVNDITLGALKLGQPKAEAEKALPRGKQYRRKDLPDGVSVLILTPPDKLMPYWAKQLLVRYHDGLVSEIRLRYQKGPAQVKKGAAEPLFQTLSDASGAPEPLPPTWAGLWGDLSNPGKVVYYRWRDDRTVRTYQCDDGGMEVIWLDRPPRSAGLDAAPWRFVSDGIPNARLGESRESVEAYFKSPATTNDGGEVYRTADSSPYEMVIVWYDAGKVSRVQAVHRKRSGGKPKEVVEALNAVWGKDLDGLGAIARQQGELGQVLGSYWWHDDAVRVRASVQNTDQGPRIVSEWRYFPIAGDATKPGA
jgi:hypothetical protein